jgi:hypothetical protein
LVLKSSSAVAILPCNRVKLKNGKNFHVKGARMETVDVIGLICAVVAVSIVVVIF